MEKRLDRSAPKLCCDTHPEERGGGEEDGEAVDAEHHLVLVDLVLLEDAVLPLRGEAVAHQVGGDKEDAVQLLGGGGGGGGVPTVNSGRIMNARKRRSAEEPNTTGTTIRHRPDRWVLHRNAQGTSGV